MSGWRRLREIEEGILYGASGENWRIKISHFCYLTESGRVEESTRSDFLPEPLQKSAFTETDIRMIEKELGYDFPKPYIDFLQSYQLPDCFTISVSFCGDYACCYETKQEDDLFVILEQEWYTALGGGAKEFLSSIQENDMPLGAADDLFLDAGFLKIGNFEGYFVFLDLVTGEVVHIYHESIYDMSIVDGVDVSDYKQVRNYLSSCILCKDFYDFLRLVCTKDIYNEDRQEWAIRT